MSNSIHDQMFQEMREKRIFEQAKSYAYDYCEQLPERPVFPGAEALAQLEAFDEPLPAKPSSSETLLDDLHRLGSPATVAQIGGRYFGFVNGGVVPAALAARWLTDFWDQNTPLYITSPIVAKLEAVCERWLQQLLELPDHTAAGFVSGSSSAILCGLAAARYRLYQRLGWDINQQGFHGAPRLRVVAGREAHGTVVKMLALLGFGTDSIEWVESDEQGRLCVEQLPELDAQTLLILQAGNVNSGAFDDFEALCQRARAAGAWVHIDGAFGLWAAGTQRFKHLTRGMALAQSFSVDGHKTLNTPYDNGIVLCTDREALVHALQASGSYIAYSDQRDGMLYTPEMSRRARAVELWATLKFLGASGVESLISGLHERALQLAQGLTAQGFQILNEVVFNQVVLSCGDEAHTAQMLEHIQGAGECWVGGSRWRGQAVIRISVCSWATTAEDIERTVRAFVAAREAIG